MSDPQLPMRFTKVPMWSVPASKGLGLCVLEDDPDIFTSTRHADEVAAARVCRKCPIQWECLRDTEEAVKKMNPNSRHRLNGVYGGMAFVEGEQHPPGRRVKHRGDHQEDPVARLRAEMFPNRRTA